MSYLNMCVTSLIKIKTRVVVSGIYVFGIHFCVPAYNLNAVLSELVITIEKIGHLRTHIRILTVLRMVGMGIRNSSFCLDYSQLRDRDRTSKT